MSDTHDPRTPAGRAALRVLLAGAIASFNAEERDNADVAAESAWLAACVRSAPALLDIADERDRLAALLREARRWVARGPHRPVELLGRIDEALAKEGKP